MKNTRLQIQFDGFKFHGWQLQTNSSPTVQGEINKALALIYKQRVSTMGAGRTDAKVHAKKYYVFFEAPFDIPCDALKQGLNSKLPVEIRVDKVETLIEPIHPTMDAKSREYRYYFSNTQIPSPFLTNYMANISYSLDVEKMQQACLAFVGTFDFASFQTVGSDVKSTTRTIFDCKLSYFEASACGLYPERYCITVVGSGFLKQMVRLMVGAIWDVGRGKLAASDITHALEQNIGEHIAAVAPAQGLYKFDVQY